MRFTLCSNISLAVATATAAAPASSSSANLTATLVSLNLTDCLGNITSDPAISKRFDALTNVTIFASDNGAYENLNLVLRALESKETIVQGGLDYVVVDGIHRASSFPPNTTILPTHLHSNLTKHKGPADIKIVKQGDSINVVSAAELSSTIVLAVCTKVQY
jgi:hypothetical protein